MLHVACGNRRETVCPACSAIYKRDARQLVRAGLAGGKGMPETDHRASVRVRHPHRPLLRPGPLPPDARQDRPALPPPPRRQARRCPHGRDISCPTRHMDEDPRLGQPLCGDCYDYEAAVLFNAYAGDLWRRFTTYLPRHLARLAGVTQKALRSVLRIRYVKVAEYQARGIVHFHAVIRLDAPGRTTSHRPPGTPPRCCATPSARPPPPSPVTTGPAGPAVRLTFGAPDRRPAHPPRQRPARHRAGPVRPGRGQLHRQIRHQDPHRARRARTSASAPPSTFRACAAPATTSG